MYKGRLTKFPEGSAEYHFKMEDWNAPPTNKKVLGFLCIQKTIRKQCSTNSVCVYILRCFAHQAMETKHYLLLVFLLVSMFGKLN